MPVFTVGSITAFFVVFQICISIITSPIYRTRSFILLTQRKFWPCNAGVAGNSRCLNLDFFPTFANIFFGMCGFFSPVMFVCLCVLSPASGQYCALDVCGYPLSAVLIDHLPFFFRSYMTRRAAPSFVPTASLCVAIWKSSVGNLKIVVRFVEDLCY